MIASSRPSISSPEPTSWDSPLGGGLVDLLAVDGGRQVDGDEVAVCGRPLDAGEGAEPLAQRASSCSSTVLVGDLDVVDRDRDARVVRQVDLGTHVDLGGERRALAVLELGDLDLGLAERLDLVLA